MSLWLPETHYATDEKAIAAALRAYDDDLRLVPQPSPKGLVYHVRRWRGGDQPSEFLFAWVNDHGDPLPLSTKLLELVKAHDRNTRATVLDADVRNELKKQAEAKQWDRDVDAITGDWLMPHGRPVLPRSTSLRMSRDKRRERGEKV